MAEKLLTANEKTQGKPFPNFSFAELEFYSRIPSELIPNATTLLKNLQALRDACGKPIVIRSGYRDESRQAIVNEKVKKSQHSLAAASDITIKGMTPKEVANLIEKLISEKKMDEGGIGVYSDFVHYDCRCNLTVAKDFPTARARWNG